MIRERTEEYLVGECPNCGAPRSKEVRECTFCGTSLVKTRIVRDDLHSERFPVVTAVNKKKAIENRNLEAEIVSTMSPKTTELYTQMLCVGGFGIALIIFLILILSSWIKGDFDGGMAVFLSFLILAMTIYLFTVVARDIGMLRAKSRGQEYSALILRTGASVRVMEDSKYYRELFVLAEINGREKCIKLLAQDVPKWECDLLYPTGGEIVIKGKGKSFTVKEEPQ